MKKLLLSLFACTLLLSVFAAPKTYKLLNSTTNWSLTSNWSPAGLPHNGDTINIPENIRLTLSSDFTFSNLYINLYGGLIISGNNMKITLSGSSTINVHTTGWIDGDKASQQIVLGSIIYKGDYPVLTGPKMATTNSGGFAPYQEFTILPVQFIGFTAARNSNGFLLQWTAAEEKSAAFYEVQRSTNGTTWNSIATIKPYGNTINQYSFTDKTPAANTVYYRVKQVDIDGATTFTAVRTLKNSNTVIPAIIVFQNTITVTFPNQQKGSVSIEVIGLNGLLITKQQLNEPAGSMRLTAAGLRGLYIVRVSNGQDLNTAKQIFL